jgi:protein-disulfide isomerase
MSNASSGDSRLTKNERREAAREKARLLREEQRKKDVRNRVFLISGLSVVVIAIIVGITLIIVSAIKPAGPGPLNMASDGIKISQGFKAETTPALAADATPKPNPTDYESGVADIQIYVDYICPYCGQFEATNAEQIGEWIDQGAATLEIHPLSILDRSSLGKHYSTRAANAAACVANYSPDQFYDFSALLFTNQPAENTDGLDDSKLKDLTTQAKVTAQTEINKCIDDQQFKGWVTASSARALKNPIPNSDLPSVSGTPTVLVNGQQYKGALTDADAFSAFVLQASQSFSTPAPTGTPTPGATSTPTPSSTGTPTPSSTSTPTP